MKIRITGGRIESVHSMNRDQGRYRVLFNGEDVSHDCYYAEEWYETDSGWAHANTYRVEEGFVILYKTASGSHAEPPAGRIPSRVVVQEPFPHCAMETLFGRVRIEKLDEQESR